MSHLGTCKFFNGFFARGEANSTNKRCDAGVQYRAEFGPALSTNAPCIEHYVRTDHGTIVSPMEKYTVRPARQPGLYPAPCSRRCEPTDEEIEQDVQETNAWIDRSRVGIVAANAWRVRPKPAEDRKGVVECPICKGRLHMVQSSYNGHVHGKCETRDCLEWME